MLHLKPSYQLILLFSLLYTNLIQAQNTFNLIIEDTTLVTQTGRTIYHLADSSYILFGSILDYQSLLQGITLKNLNQEGQINWSKTYIDNLGSYYTGLQESLIQVENDNFFWGGVYATGGGSTGNFRMIKFNAQGDSLWSRTFGGQEFESGYRSILTSEGNYVELGITSSYGAGGYDAYIVKMDSLGNTLWETTVGGEGDDYAIDAITLPNDRLLVFGSNHSYFANQVPYFFFLDKDGNVEKEITLQTNHIGGTVAVQTLDKNIVFKETKDTIVTQWLNEEPNFIIKVDTLGDIKWEVPFYSNNYIFAYEIEALADSTILVMGNTNDNPEERIFGWLARISNDGELLWYKEYAYDDSVDNLLIDVSPTLDGGFIATGRVNYNPDQIWLLKVNCEGEFEDNPDCTSLIIPPDSSSVSIPKIEHLKNLTIYPNPAYDQTTVYWSTLKPNHNYRLGIYQANGHLIEETNIYSSAIKYDLSVHDYPLGIYWVLLYDEMGLMARSRLVVID